MIRASAPYTSGWGSFVLLKIDCVRVARGGSLSTLHRRVENQNGIRVDVGIHQGDHSISLKKIRLCKLNVNHVLICCLQKHPKAEYLSLPYMNFSEFSEFSRSIMTKSKSGMVGRGFTHLATNAFHVPVIQSLFSLVPLGRYCH